ncbi:SNF5-domain-containing protein [Aulographum hederae CBS 113979]|uniref:SNF5-domain-containing protein n=1 Tax=Aulographum hederae CBS 113979 TaxID=1176131 RepID=A0A6G1GTW0_9PEZI|nr:SNF5-domain-containing protein [Aulographum hederae CBS 113979]
MSNAAPDPVDDQSAPLSESNNTHARNGDAEGVVHAHSENGGASNTAAIREGKERAKAVMAASGVSVNSDQAHEMDSGETNAPESSSHPVNGTSQGRKRSRSGSQIPNHGSDSEAQSQARADVQDYLLNLYQQRDQTHAESLNIQSIYVRDLFTQLRTDAEYYKDLRQQRQVDPAAVFGIGYAGYGNGHTGERMHLLYPMQRKAPGGRRSKGVQVSRKDTQLHAELLEELVPVRLDIEFDKIKLRDTFTWNLRDRITSEEAFAQTLVEDFQIPIDHAAGVIREVSREIKDQVGNHFPHVFFEDKPLDPNQPYFAYKNDEMRILIKLNITIGQHTLVDQFEWEINNPLNNPEDFARQMGRDLSLSGEFVTAIAHCIREQIQLFTRSLYLRDHPFDGRTIEDSDLRDGFLSSPLPSVFRPQQAAKDYTPYLYELNEADIQREELSILREQRRQKRSVTRRGGIALPDLKDRQRTVRTLIVSSVLPGAAETVESSRLFKLSRSASGRSRRTTGRGDGGDDSDESESEESVDDSPAVQSQVLTGTARTRGIRGAATAAQAAMRANLGRSATPELAALHHHETRTSARRFGGALEGREESVAEPTSLIIKLRISRQKYREWWRNRSNGRTGEYPQQQSHSSTPLMATQTNTPQHSQPAGPMHPPPSPAVSTMTGGAGNNTEPRTPSRSQSKTPAPKEQSEHSYYPDGRLDAPYPQPAGQAPVPPPPWMEEALAALRLKPDYENHSFEGQMRWTAVDRTTGQSARLDPLPPGAQPPANLKFQYLPRIRCNDCPGKVYTAGPGTTLENFEVHLKRGEHQKHVRARLEKEAAK